MANLVQNIVDFELIWVIGGKTIQLILREKESIVTHIIEFEDESIRKRKSLFSDLSESAGESERHFYL